MQGSHHDDCAEARGVDTIKWHILCDPHLHRAHHKPQQSTREPNAHNSHLVRLRCATAYPLTRKKKSLKKQQKTTTKKKKMNGVVADRLPAFLFVVGFQMSGLGKGTIASSIGLLLKGYGLRVSAVKIDPYLNIDAGTMSPMEHGEVYVLADGGECDLDLGNYERFVGIELTRAHNITTGQVYREVIERERTGGYLGRTVQVIPHVTDHIEKRLLDAAQLPVDDTGLPPEVVIVELGGTVGDIESEPFLHVIAQFGARTGAKTCVLAIGLVVQTSGGGELKTKLMQHAVKELRSKSIAPDILCVRCDVASDEFPEETRKKIASFCLVSPQSVVVSGKVSSIYEVPDVLHKQQLHELVCGKLGLLWRGTMSPDFQVYNRILKQVRGERLSNQSHNEKKRSITVAIVAKYIGRGATDTYLSLTRALEHAAFALECNMTYTFVDSEHLENDEQLHQFTHILIPGGFGNRGIEGKIRAIAHAKKTSKPLLGICLGMQLFVVEHCRANLGWTDANSTEFDERTTHAVVKHLSAYGTIYEAKSMPLGGTMRLGNQQTQLLENSKVSVAYSQTIITERHRHRYEVAPELDKEVLRGSGLLVSGWTHDDEFHVPQVVESVNDDWWAVGCQFHPEYTSRNDRPHPLFLSFFKN
jgi:CTP synthase